MQRQERVTPKSLPRDVPPVFGPIVPVGAWYPCAKLCSAPRAVSGVRSGRRADAHAHALESQRLRLRLQERVGNLRRKWRRRSLGARHVERRRCTGKARALRDCPVTRVETTRELRGQQQTLTGLAFYARLRG